jgi:phosphohistidine phosphatase
MTEILLLRHGKAEAPGFHLEDHSRALMERGRRNIEELAEIMLKHDWLPEIVLCSTAKRTRETLHQLQIDLKISPQTIFPKSLYGGWADSYLEEIMARTEQRILLIGHNPSISELASDLLAKAVALKTSGAVLIGVDDSWRGELLWSFRTYD